MFICPYMHLEIPALMLPVCWGGEHSHKPHNDVSDNDGTYI